MKKTLKILMALILFAVVIMLATSVNAATEVKVSELAAKDPLDKGVTKTGNILTITTTGADAYAGTEDLIVDQDLYISGGYTGKITINSNATLTMTDATAANYTKDITNNGKIIATANSTIARLINSGVAELAAKPTSLVMKSGSVIKTSAAKFDYDNKDFMTDTVAKEYAAGVWTDGTSKYILPLNTIEFKAYAADRAGDPIEVATAGQAHDLVLEATCTYDGKKVELETTGAAWALTKADEDSTDLAVAANKITVQTARVGTEVKLAATVNGQEIEFVIFEAKSQDDNNGDNNQGDNNQGDNNQGDNNQGDNNQGDNNEENKGDANQNEDKKDENNNDLDDTPKTGDHIIPATALLAVVVVANVVYFAKMKRN